MRCYDRQRDRARNRAPLLTPFLSTTNIWPRCPFKPSLFSTITSNVEENERGGARTREGVDSIHFISSMTTLFFLGL